MYDPYFANYMASMQNFGMPYGGTGYRQMMPYMPAMAGMPTMMPGTIGPGVMTAMAPPADQPYRFCAFCSQEKFRQATAGKAIPNFVWKTFHDDHLKLQNSLGGSAISPYAHEAYYDQYSDQNNCTIA